MSRPGAASLAPSAMPPDQPSPAPPVATIVLGRRRGICISTAGVLRNRLVEDDVLVVEQLAELRHQVMRIDRAGLALVRRELGGLGEALFARGRQMTEPCRRGRPKARRCLGLQLRQQLLEDAAAVALHAQMTREGPHRRAELEDVNVDMSPERVFARLHIGGEPRHVDIDEHPDVGLGQRIVGRKAGEAGARVRDVVPCIGLEHGDAGELRDLVDHPRALRIASAIAGDQDRIVGGEQPIGERGDELRIGAAGRHRAEPVAGIAVNLIDTPVLRQRLALHHQIDRTARLALHDRRSALQRLLDDNAGRQRPLPFHIGAHQACLIERLLHEMNMGIARADQFAVALYRAPCRPSAAPAGGCGTCCAWPLPRWRSRHRHAPARPGRVR